MINAITGLPGNAKTLFTIKRVHEWRLEQEKKTGKLPNVYYFNIKFYEDHDKYELVKDWIALNKSEIQSLQLTLEQEEESDTVLNHAAIVEKESLNPDSKIKTVVENGSILIIDESQDVYPTRAGSAAVPRFVKFFEKHRHSGLNFYLVTQDVTYLDAHLRKLINYHYELDRHGKAEISNVRISPKGILANCPPDLIKTEVFKFPKLWFGLYKSAVEHTQTDGILDFIKGLPLKVKIIIFALILFGTFTVSSLMSDGMGLNTLQDSTSVAVSASSDSKASSPSGLNATREEGQAIFYLSHYLSSKDKSQAVFSLVYPDGSQISLIESDVQELGFEFKTIRTGVYLINNSLVTYFPNKRGSKKDDKDSKN